ncbi:helix-turn-helix transcriptional regulator [bacterium]|nr:helix-turn-helix transcriptional regulator [bacterium]
MKSEIGTLVGKSRQKFELTQDQFGRKYNVSGPAIFKFEKGYVKPSLDLWLLMAKDMEVDEQTAVLMWVRSKLPRKYQSFISLDTPAVSETAKAYGRTKKVPKEAEPEDARKHVLADRAAPKGLKRLLKDEDLWALYKPQTHEISILVNTFGQLGDGSKSSYREALRLIREFSCT